MARPRIVLAGAGTGRRGPEGPVGPAGAGADVTAAEIQAAKVAAEQAAVDAEAAKVAVEAVEATTDGLIASQIQTPGSQTETALSAAIGEGVAGKADAADVYTKTQTDTSYARKKAGTKIAFIGDSITANGTFDANRTGGKGYAPHALMYAKGRLANVRRDAANHYFATSGYSVAQIISAGYHTAAAASAADIVVIHAGTNQLASSAAAIFTDLQTIYSTLLAAGKTVVATTLLPRGSGASAALHTRIQEVNDLIRPYAQSTPGVVLCDWHNVLMDPATGYLSTAYSPDELHPNVPGASRLGKFLGELLLTLTAATAPLVIPNLRARKVTTNPFATGNVAGLATGWVKTNQGTPTSVTLSKVPRTDGRPGEWQQAVVVAANPLTDGVLIYDRVDHPNIPLVAGDVIQAFAEVEIDAAGLDARFLALSGWMAAGSIAFGALFNSAETPSGSRAPMPSSGYLISDPVTLTVTPTTGQYTSIGVQFLGSGTIRIGNMQIVKVN